MSDYPLLVTLPIADRKVSFHFYRDGMGFAPIGEPAEDGVPEPLQFAINDGVRIMLVPSGGFGWIIGGNEVAARGKSECVIGLSTGTDAGVDETIQRARRAGGDVILAPGRQPWGYAGAFADPDGHVWMASAQRPPD
jgi:uncharacterized protein